MSKRVKRRAAFRPYALSVAAGAEDRFLHGTEDGDLAAWMQRSYAVRTDVVESVRGAVHVDGTTRAQICDSGANASFHRLLSAYGEASGSPALLNTSFNEPGSPLVNTPEEAMIMFLRTDMDCLAFDGLFLEKTA